MPVHPGIIPWQCTAPRLYYRDNRLNMVPLEENDLNGGLLVQHVHSAVNYQADIDDYIVGVDTTGGARTITLPTAGVESGRVYMIADEGGNAAIAAITVDTEGAETVNGGASITLAVAYGNVLVWSDGTNWFAGQGP